MTVRVTCPNPDCGAVANVEEQSLGRRGRCKKCGHVFALARPDGEPASAMSGDASAWKGSSPASPTNLPEQFGRYRIMRQLGQGGMGAVYLAHDTKLDRPVALKVPFFHPSDGPQAIQRFEREARAAANLDHPNLCPIYDVGEVDGIHYLTMPYIEGKPLSEALAKDQIFTEPQAAAVVRKLALALQEAHDKGVVHRDLKPANIMIKRGRDLVIMDFGLARMAGGEDGQLTRTGHVLGTALYMAPEQAAGDTAATGPACDVYALGVILHELLTGRRPFEGPWSLVIGLKNVKDPEPPSKHRPGLSPALDAICLKAIAQKPEDRYRTMAEFAESLNDFSSQTPSPSPVLMPSRTAHPTPSPESLAVQVFAGLVGHEVTTLREEKAPANPKPAPPEGKTPRLPAQMWIAAAGAVGALLLGIGIYVATDQGRTNSPKSAAETAPPQPKVDDTIITNTLGMKLTLIPAGRFQMGSDASDPDASSDEMVNGKTHPIRITRPFYLGTTEVTVGQFRQFVEMSNYKTEAERDGTGGNGWNEAGGMFEEDPKYTWRSPGFPQEDDHPVVIVSWNDAVSFCGWLGKQEGQTYRLPTEAEWEYACRAGQATRYSSGDGPESLATVGNVADGTAKEKYPDWTYAITAKDGYVFTAPVGRFRPNGFGLFDMHGNVWEWCADCYGDDYYSKSPSADPVNSSRAASRVIRGGAWNRDGKFGRSAYRVVYVPTRRYFNLGFRVARVR